MKCLVFSTEPVGPNYRALVDFCCSVTAQLLLVVRDRAPAIEQTLGQLRADFLKEEQVREWPGTVLAYGSQATAHWHNVSIRLRENLKTLADGLFEWVGFMPEDPCFFRADGRVFLVTTSHERTAYMLLTEGEYAALQREFPGLASILNEEGEG